MIIVREVFIAKPGQASTMAKMMKEHRPDSKVLSDMTGVFNKVVVETEYADLSAFETAMKEYMAGTLPQKPRPGYTELYTNGKREIYRVW